MWGRIQLGSTAAQIFAIPVILIAEYFCVYLWLVFLFDRGTVRQLPGMWQTTTDYIFVVMGGCIIAICIAVMLWSRAIVDYLKHTADTPQRIDFLWLGVHMGTLVAFGGLSYGVLANTSFTQRAGAPLFILWFGLGVLLLFSLSRAFLGEEMRPFLRRIGRPAILSVAVGTILMLAAKFVMPSWQLLALPTLLLCGGLLRLISSAVYVDSTDRILGLGDFVVEIAPSCSGVEGMGLIAALLGIFLFVFRREHRFPQALILFPMGIVLAFLSNILRIVMLMIIGAYVDPEIARGAFHSLAGWIFFCTLSIGIIAYSHRISWLTTENTTYTTSEENPTAVFVMPLLVWLSLGMLTNAISSIGDPFYPIRVLVLSGILWAYRDTYREILSESLHRHVSRSTVAPARLSIKYTTLLQQKPLERNSSSYSSLGYASLCQHLLILKESIQMPFGIYKAIPWLGGSLIFGMWLLLPPPSDVERDTQLAASVMNESSWASLGWLGGRIIGTVCIVPIIEELAFRGYLQRWLHSQDFVSVSYRHFHLMPVAVSAVAFGLLHPNWVAGIIAGVIFSGIMAVRGRLTDAMIAHGVANALLSIWVLCFGRWDLW